jgi:diguanylate cyclase (GGDEF)-like protein
MGRTYPARLRSGLEQMARALREHEAWQERLLRRIVAGAPLLACDHAPDAQLRCPFDDWYFDRSPPAFWGYPAFASLGVEHHRLHRVGEELLQRLAADAPVTVEDFDVLLEGPARMREILAALQTQIEVAHGDRDEKTGACGRQLMLRDLRAWRELAASGLVRCCIVRVEIDDPQGLRDACGPRAADENLTATVKFVRRHVRPYDRLYGREGEQLLLALPGADLAAAQAVIKRVRERLVRRPGIAVAGGRELAVTASFGLAQLDPQVDVEESIERADQALLLAKTAGRNLAMSWDPSVTTGVRLPRLRLEDVGE